LNTETIRDDLAEKFSKILFKHGLLAWFTLKCNLFVTLIESSGLQGHSNVAGVGTTSSEGVNMTRRKEQCQIYLLVFYCSVIDNSHYEATLFSVAIWFFPIILSAVIPRKVSKEF